MEDNPEKLPGPNETEGPFGALDKKFDKLSKELTGRLENFLSKRVDRLEKFADELEPQLNRRVTEWGTRNFVRSFVWVSSSFAEHAASFGSFLMSLKNMPNPGREWAKYELTKGLFPRFLEDFNGIVAKEFEHRLVKDLPLPEQARYARWMSATVIDELLVQARKPKNRTEADQFRLMGRQIFFKGVGLSEKLGSGKIDPAWIHEIGANLINPTAETTTLKERLDLFINNPPLMTL